MDCEAGSAPTPPPRNEPVHDYAPGSPERRALQAELKSMLSERVAAPLVINGARIETGEIVNAVCPHDHEHVLAHVHQGGAAEAEQAIAAALAVHPEWSGSDWRVRASVFLKAADLLSGPWRARLNAATMLGQSKTVHQAEIDAAAELADFWRFNVHFMERLYQEQPLSPAGVWNRSDYRPLEGFVYAVTPFNFTAIAGNLPTAPALMGNTVLWKPSPHAMLSAHYVMALLEEAGLPPGVINLVYGDAEEISEVALSNESLAGVHFTGSTAVYDAIRRKVERRRYKNYPRLVGETGGKNFILVHESADLNAATTAVIRGAYEYQGQKCSAASRIFAPRPLWSQLKQRLIDQIGTIPMGDVADFRCFMGAVISAAAWARHDAVLKAASTDPAVTVLAGGGRERTTGYFVEPTLLETSNPTSRFMREEFFGPIACVFVYDNYEETLGVIDRTSAYGLTGAVFACDRRAIELASNRLRYAAGNFYINDKPTGAVVGQQPFGGARASGTNDKAGALWNLARWTSPRTIKETLNPPTHYGYPFMKPEEA